MTRKYKVKKKKKLPSEKRKIILSIGDGVRKRILTYVVHKSINDTPPRRVFWQ